MLTILMKGLRDLSIEFVKMPGLEEGDDIGMLALRPVLLEASIGRGLGRKLHLWRGFGIRGAHLHAHEMLSPWVISITSAVVIVGLTIIIIRSVQVTS